MNTEFVKGSEWRRWELHIHTPGTQKNDNFYGSSLEEKWDKYYKDISEYIGDGTEPLKNIAVIAITDYLSVDNYKKVISDNKLPESVKLVLPNVEMRVQPIAKDFPINIHFIFNPEIMDTIEDRFFSKLKFIYGGSTTFSASRNELIRLGKCIDTKLDDNSAYKRGISQFIPSFDKIQEVFLNDRELRNNTMIFVSNSSNDGVTGAVNHSEYLSDKGDSQLKAFRQSIYKFVDGIFSAKPSDISYFLGKKANCPI